MKKVLLVLLVTVSLLFSLAGCGAASFSGGAAPLVSHGEVALSFAPPQGKWRLLGTAADDAGAAAVYETIEQTTSSLDPAKRSLFVQFFAPDGRHLLTSDCLGYLYDDNPVEASELRLTAEDFSFCLNGESYYAAQRETGGGSSFSFYTIGEDSGCTLEFSPQYFYTQDSSRLLFRYTDAAGAQLLISCDEPIDESFVMALYETVSGDPEQNAAYNAPRVSCRMDTAAKTAVLSGTKLTYTLDFAEGSYTLQRSYTPEMLSAEPVAVSPSGQRQLYTADEGGSGDVFWRDLVLQDETGLRYVGTYSLFSATFVGDDAFVVENVLSAARFDTDTLSPVLLPGLTFPRTPFYEALTTPEKWILGLAYDAQNELFLAAVRDFSADALELPVTLLMLDSAGELLREIPTEYMVYTYHNNYPEQCVLSLANGVITLSSYLPDRPTLQVAYLAK